MDIASVVVDDAVAAEEEDLEFIKAV